MAGQHYVNDNEVRALTLEHLQAVMVTGDKYGSGLKDMLRWLKIVNLTNVTDKQVEMYLEYLQSKNNDK